MSRYIDADKLADKYDEILQNPEYDKPIHDMLIELYFAPGEDVEPVRHGFWTYICNSSLGLKICECSICHKRTYGSLTYCANCGAKMDAGVAHNKEQENE